MQLYGLKFFLHVLDYSSTPFDTLSTGGHIERFRHIFCLVYN
jgi:hypothetical protein